MIRSRSDGSLEVSNSLPARMALARWRAVAKSGEDEAGCTSARSASRWDFDGPSSGRRVFSSGRDFAGGEGSADPRVVRVEVAVVGEA